MGLIPQLMLKIIAPGRVDPDAEDILLAYDLEMTWFDGTTTLELNVVLNTNSPLEPTHHPYRPHRRFWDLSELGRETGPLPNSPLSLRDWIGRSRLPNKRNLFELVEGQRDDTTR